MFDTNWDEHYIRRGDPSKPTYYIIRHHDTAVGLFALFNNVAGHIRYALSHGWLPVVDMQNYPNVHLAPEKLGKENSWEYYFEQPLRIGLEQAYNGENIILCNTFLFPTEPFPIDNIDFCENRNGIVTEWRMLVKLGLLKIKSALHEKILTIREKLFAPNDKVLGLILRGTDYIDRKPYKHSIPPPQSLPQACYITNFKNGIAINSFWRRKTKTTLRFSKILSANCA